MEGQENREEGSSQQPNNKVALKKLIGNVITETRQWDRDWKNYNQDGRSRMPVSVDQLIDELTEKYGNLL